MATAMLQLDEERLIREWIAEIQLPKGVHFREIKEIVDSTGSPAWQIDFAVSKRLGVSEPLLRTVDEMADALRKRIYSLESDHWPYIRFVEGR